MLTPENFRDGVKQLAAGFFGIPAIYTPKAGEPIACRVRWKEPDGVFTGHGVGVRSPRRQADIRAAEVPDPQEGDSLAVNGVSYTVATVSAPDRHRLLHRLELNE